MRLIVCLSHMPANDPSDEVPSAPPPNLPIDDVEDEKRRGSLSEVAARPMQKKKGLRNLCTLSVRFSFDLNRRRIRCSGPIARVLGINAKQPHLHPHS